MEREYRCKNCGGNLIMQSNMRSARCDSCDSLFEIDDNRTKFVNDYTQADDAWSRKDFDEAIKHYQNIVDEDNLQSEAHWGIALCRYGIAYEIDPVTLKKMPTCNRINRESILNDKNYLSAIKYAGEEAKKSYKQRAEEIEKISRDFLKIVDKEEPYDVFISYKRTNPDGSRTIDSQLAMKLFLFLKEKGIRAFFAEETLRNVGGEKYEPYIFAALNSARVMVLVGSSKENIEATWVKNEWRRFLHLSQEDPKKVLIPAYLGKDFYQIFPQELLSIQAYDMASPVFLEEITENIKKKLDGKAVPKAGRGLEERYAQPEKVDKLVQELDCEPQFAVDALVLKQGNINEAKKFIQADSKYQKALWICAECGSANTHDVCHKKECALSKADSIRVESMRKAEEEKKKRQSSQYKRKRNEMLKKVGAVVGILTALVLLTVFVIYPYIIVPNQSTDVLNTPEIVQTYSGDNGTYGRIVMTIKNCTPDGQVTANFEFIRDSLYGKVKLEGQITNKKNNGDVTITWSTNTVEVMPAEITWENKTETKITSKWTKLKIGGTTLSNKVDSDSAISNVNDLQKLAGSSNLFILRSDIDLAGSNWSPISGFTGTLIGGGYKIQNLNIEGSGDNVGFFSTLEGTVMNLEFENATVIVSGRSENVGVLCGTLTGSAANITVSGTVKADMGTNVGGVIGSVNIEKQSYMIAELYNSATVSGAHSVAGCIGSFVNKSYNNTSVISDLTNTGNITATGDQAGGCIGWGGHKDHTLQVLDCVNKGDITGVLHVGGIAGYLTNRYVAEQSYIQNCSSSGAITGEAKVGGIAGYTSGINMDSCSNTGSKITATKYYIDDEGIKRACVGGYLGMGFAVNNCVNEADITYTAGGRCVGGIAGFINIDCNSYGMSNLENKGNISGADNVGGIIGSFINKSYHNISVFSNLKNSGNITGTGVRVSGCLGFAGHKDHSLQISDCTNTGEITGTQYVGGIGGEIIGYYSAGEAFIRSCSSSATINGEAYVGGIAGSATGLAAEDCSNTGSTINATGYVVDDGIKRAYVGGYFGEATLVNNCVNAVDIHYTAGGRGVGGIVGYIVVKINDYTMTGLENTGNITGCSSTGGCIGTFENSSYYDISRLSDFKNSGNITGNGDNVGGIIGYAGHRDNSIQIIDFENSGNVKGNSTVGGLCGYIMGSSRESSVTDCTSTGSVSGNSYKGERFGQISGFNL